MEAIGLVCVVPNSKEVPHVEAHTEQHLYVNGSKYEGNTVEALQRVWDEAHLKISIPLHVKPVGKDFFFPGALKYHQGVVRAAHDNESLILNIIYGNEQSKETSLNRTAFFVDGSQCTAAQWMQLQTGDAVMLKHLPKSRLQVMYAWKGKEPTQMTLSIHPIVHCRLEDKDMEPLVQMSVVALLEPNIAVVAGKLNTKGTKCLAVLHQQSVKRFRTADNLDTVDYHALRIGDDITLQFEYRSSGTKGHYVLYATDAWIEGVMSPCTEEAIGFVGRIVSTKVTPLHKTHDWNHLCINDSKYEGNTVQSLGREWEQTDLRLDFPLKRELLEKDFFFRRSLENCEGIVASHDDESLVVNFKVRSRLESAVLHRSALFVDGSVCTTRQWLEVHIGDKINLKAQGKKKQSKVKYAWKGIQPTSMTVSVSPVVEWKLKNENLEEEFVEMTVIALVEPNCTLLAGKTKSALKCLAVLHQQAVQQGRAESRLPTEDYHFLRIGDIIMLSLKYARSGKAGHYTCCATDAWIENVHLPRFMVTGAPFGAVVMVNWGEVKPVCIEPSVSSLLNCLYVDGGVFGWDSFSERFMSGTEKEGAQALYWVSEEPKFIFKLTPDMTERVLFLMKPVLKRTGGSVVVRCSKNKTVYVKRDLLIVDGQNCSGSQWKELKKGDLISLDFDESRDLVRYAWMGGKKPLYFHTAEVLSHFPKEVVVEKILFGIVVAVCKSSTSAAVVNILTGSKKRPYLKSENPPKKFLALFVNILLKEFDYFSKEKNTKHTLKIGDIVMMHIECCSGVWIIVDAWNRVDLNNRNVQEANFRESIERQIAQQKVDDNEDIEETKSEDTEPRGIMHSKKIRDKVIMEVKDLKGTLNTEENVAKVESDSENKNITKVESDSENKNVTKVESDSENEGSVMEVSTSHEMKPKERNGSSEHVIPQSSISGSRGSVQSRITAQEDSLNAECLKGCKLKLKDEPNPEALKQESRNVDPYVLLGCGSITQILSKSLAVIETETKDKILLDRSFLYFDDVVCQDIPLENLLGFCINFHAERRTYLTFPGVDILYVVVCAWIKKTPSMRDILRVLDASSYMTLECNRDYVAEVFKPLPPMYALVNVISAEEVVPAFLPLSAFKQHCGEINLIRSVVYARGRIMVKVKKVTVTRNGHDIYGVMYANIISIESVPHGPEEITQMVESTIGACFAELSEVCGTVMEHTSNIEGLLLVEPLKLLINFQVENFVWWRDIHTGDAVRSIKSLAPIGSFLMCCATRIEGTDVFRATKVWKPVMIKNNA